MDLRDFLDIFLSESREHLEGLNQLIIAAREHPLDQEAINDLFRHAHSLKGMAASMGFRPMADLSHAMEDIFHGWRDRGLEPSAESLDLLQRGSDRLAAQVDAVAANQEPQPETDLAAALRACLTGATEGVAGGGASPNPAATAGSPAPAANPGSPAPNAPPAPPAGASGAAPDTPPIELRIALREGTPLPAARALVLLKNLAGMGQILSSLPSVATLGSGSPFDGRLRVTLTSRTDSDRVRTFILGLPDVEDCQVMRRPGERRRSDQRAPVATDEASPGGDPGPEPAAPRLEAVGTVRVATERIDRLLDGIGELILQRERLKRALGTTPETPGLAMLESLGRTIDALHVEIVAIRMIPFSSLVPRLQRMVRELSRRLAKPLEMEVRGADVALDRSILEEMMAPLEHILRNSIDHGLEDAAGRRAGAKPMSGRIEIVLAAREGRVILAVEDDGRGIDPAALRRVAIERRFLTRDQAERLTDDESLMLITLPGFSTAARTTDISGRGVGMDVVLTQVRKLGGRLTVKSRVGAGTRFEMDLPPTVTVTRAFLCRAGGEIYALPVSVVQNTLELKREGLQGRHGDQLVRQGDEVLTVLPLHGLLQGDTEALLPATFPAFLYREGTRSYALAVEEILGEQEIVVKPLKRPLELLPQYAGAAILNDGEIALILDPVNLARSARAG